MSTIAAKSSDFQAHASHEHQDEESTVKVMTPQLIRKICKDSGMYQTPNLNDKLYLHFKCFKKIENLEEYSEVKALWLESNAITKIENLGHMHGLVCLYLQQNAIEKIEGLQNLHHLHSLNLSNNRIRKIEGLEGCPDLDTLDISNNRLISLEDVQALSQLKKLTVLDIQNNYINDERVIEEVFNQMPELGVIYLQLNPIVNKTKNYRKRLISGLPLLKYLDDRPIFPEERRCVMAWVEGGVEAEQDERHKIIEEKEAARKKNLADFEAMQQRSRQRIMEERGISSDDPSLYQSYGIDSDTESEGSDEEATAEEEAGPVEEVEKTEETEEPAPTNEEDNLSVHQIKIEEVEENEVD